MHRNILPKGLLLSEKIDSRGRKGTLFKQTNAFKGNADNGEIPFFRLSQIVCFFSGSYVEHVEYVESLSLFETKGGG